MKLIYLPLLMLISCPLFAVIEGSCTNSKIPLTSPGSSTISSAINFFVLNNDTPTYLEPNDASITNSRLQFAEQLILKEKRNDFFKTNEGDWVKTDDILCGGRALKDNKNLDRKAFPKPRAYRAGTEQASVKAYKSYDAKDCSNCGLKRFKHYYILAESKNRFLLSEINHLHNGQALIGWVDKEYMISWPTSIAIRPDINANTRINILSKPDKTASDSGTIKGGKQWLKKTMHIPVLDKIDKYYKIAYPGIIKGGDLDSSGFDYNEKAINNGIELFKKLDIFFLIDGTASMGSYIEQTKQITTKIIEKLGEKYADANFRLGFLIYRDNYANNRILGHNNGLGEYLNLGTTCEGDELKDNLKDFEEALKPVHATQNDTGDGYPEQLFVGLKAAFEAMNTCRDRSKLLFVIGNAGANGNSSDFTSTFDDYKNFETFMPFFVRAQVNCIGRPFCVEAYRKYYTDAIDFITSTKPSTKQQIVSPSNYIIDLDATGLITQLESKLATYANTLAINKVGQHIRTGQSIVESVAIIDDVEFRGELKRVLCKKIPDQCEKGITHITTEAYVPITDKVIEEVWMSSQQLEDWLTLLKAPVTGERETQRDEMIHKIKQNLNLITASPNNNLHDDETIGSFIKRVSSGLPLRDRSPFTQLTVNNIKQMDDICFNKFKNWMELHRQILQKVSNSPERQIFFTETDGCNVNGIIIPTIKITGNKDLGNDDDGYSYERIFKSETIYWIPMDFLP